MTKETSRELASLAARYLQMTDAEIGQRCELPLDLVIFATDVRRLAASVLSQAEEDPSADRERSGLQDKE